MKKKRKTVIATLLAVAMITFSTVYALAASHDPANPTELTIGQAYQSNAYYGDEYYTFTLDRKSDVNIWLGHVAINHTYNMTLSGNDIEPISTNDSSYEDELTLDAVLEPGTYYIEVDPDFDGLKQIRTEPDETWYNIIVTAFDI